MGVRVRQRRLSGHRRHDDRRAGVARGWRPRRRGGRVRARAALDAGDGLAQRRVGGVRPRQHPGAALSHALLGLRRDDRPTDGRRDRARARDAGGARLRRERPLRGARPGVSARNAKAVGLVVRPLGRQSRLRHVVRDFGPGCAANRRRYARACRGVAAFGAECRRRVGRKLPLVCRRVVRRHRTQHAVADGLGGARRCSSPGTRNHTAVQRGLAFLCERQRRDGTWDEPECTGTGFPGDFYINYHLYRHLFPTMALALAARSHPHPSSSCHPERSEAQPSEVEGRRSEGRKGATAATLRLKEAIP